MCNLTEPRPRGVTVDVVVVSVSVVVAVVVILVLVIAADRHAYPQHNVVNHCSLVFYAPYLCWLCCCVRCARRLTEEQERVVISF